MYLKIKKCEKVPDKYGHHLKITMIGLYHKDGTWIKWVKLNDELIERLLSGKIELFD